MKRFTQNLMFGVVLVFTLGIALAGCAKTTTSDQISQGSEVKATQSPEVEATKEAKKEAKKEATKETESTKVAKATEATKTAKASEMPKDTKATTTPKTSPKTVQPTVVTKNTQATTAPKSTQATEAPKAPKTFTMEELKMYNGENGNKAYVAIDGKVYDVTNVKSWRNGMHKGNKSGNDLSMAITGAPHGESVLEGLTVVGTVAK